MIGALRVKDLMVKTNYKLWKLQLNTNYGNYLYTCWEMDELSVTNPVGLSEKTVNLWNLTFSNQKLKI